MSAREHDAEGPYVLWQEIGGGEGWEPTSFDTIKEALEYTRWCNSWKLMKPVNYHAYELKPGASGSYGPSGY